MADNTVYHGRRPFDLVRFVRDGDVIGAKRFIASIDDQDRKQFVASVDKRYALLRVAAGFGNRDMVEYLVKDCEANIEDGGKYCPWIDDNERSMTPLWYASSLGNLEVVKVLFELGAKINAVANSQTSLNVACSNRWEEIAKFLVEQGAKIHRPDKDGETCLMKSVYSLELCQILIDKGAKVNAQDVLGNTALHYAIKKGNLKIVQLLLDHDSDQNVKNKLGDDALQFASFHGRRLIVNELRVRQKPSRLRWIESLQLLGSSFVLSGTAEGIGKTFDYWTRSVALRLKNPVEELCKSESTPVGMIVQEVNTVEELEDLRQDHGRMHMYALEILLRILGMSHKETTDGLVKVSNVLAGNGKYRASCDLLKFGLQLLHERTPTWTEEYLRVLDVLHRLCSDALRESESEIEFRDILEIVDMVISNAQVVNKLNFPSMRLILKFVLLLVKLDKSSDDIVSFERTIHRLVHSQIKDGKGQTFLHHAAKQCSYYPGVVKVLLECGADVNSLDARNNTALHFVGTPRLHKRSAYDPNVRSEVVKLLLQYSAHPDIVNDRGNFADFGDFTETGLSLNMLDHVSLKCLATTVIRDHKIPYVGQIPESLESFVRMHGRRPSKKFKYRS